jgi:hypothetical protein
MAISITDNIIYRRLTAAGNNSFYYKGESMSGTMAVLTASIGDIDTSDQLEMASIFQKVFIVNGANLKVADFINTKVATTSLGSYAPTQGTVLTGGTTSARMVVDYITSDTASASCVIYGYRTTAVAFNSTETVTGIDKNGDTVSFAMCDTETTPPHWYDWKPYGNDTTLYGEMPNRAYLIAAYRGRLVIAGDTEYPNQWYMTRVASPFNFLYGSTDPLTAIAGNNADAGQSPDIIKALIPFHDDYLIFGCSESMWILRGDPAVGGSLDNFSDSTGIFGARSWCFDDSNNIYFWGNNGFYKINSDFSGVINMTAIAIPEIIEDEAPSSSTHRITLGFDKKRYGIVIAITKVSDGSNSNYFYSLKTEGFYPEKYPNECGIYSMLYYNSGDPAYDDLLMGGTDGYIRKFVDSSYSDDIGAVDAAISAYFTTSIKHLTGEEDTKGKLTSLTIVNAGASISGTYWDSSGFNYYIYRGDDAESVAEDMRDNASAFISATISSPGRQIRMRTKVSCNYMGIKILNDTEGESFAVNKICGDVKPAGKVR